MVTMTPLLALKALGCGAMLGLAIAFLEACANYTVRRLAVSVLILLTHPLVSLMLGTLLLWGDEADEVPSSTGQPDAVPSPTGEPNRVLLSTGKTETMLFSTKQACLDVLKAKDLPGSCPSRNELSPEESRAAPNQRLVVAFGIENCFVTSEKSICNAFKKNASEKLNLDIEDWEMISHVIISSLKSRDFDQHDSFKLVPEVQFIALKLALHVLCHHVTKSGDDDDAIFRLAHDINLQWIWSKTATDDLQGSLLPDIQKTLGQLFPDWKKTGYPTSSNPLNLLLPGYETLWRVVLRGLIEVVFRSGETDSHEYCRVLERFCNAPHVENYHGEDDNQVSAENIAKEALRLYPPTRRIYRRFQTRRQDGELVSVDAAADVETLHRDSTIWGGNAVAFKPSRWTTLPDGHGKPSGSAFMAFGSGPFTCLASKVHHGMQFGVAITAMMLGGLSATLCKDRWNLKPGMGPGEEDLLDLSRGPLLTDREAYAELRLVKSPPMNV